MAPGSKQRQWMPQPGSSPGLGSSSFEVTKGGPKTSERRNLYRARANRSETDFWRFSFIVRFGTHEVDYEYKE